MKLAPAHSYIQSELTIIINNFNCHSASSATDFNFAISSQSNSEILCAFNPVVSQDSDACTRPYIPSLE